MLTINYSVFEESDLWFSIYYLEFSISELL